MEPINKTIIQIYNELQRAKGQPTLNLPHSTKVSPAVVLNNNKQVSVREQIEKINTEQKQVRFFERYFGFEETPPAAHYFGNSMRS